jgi:uncharacterized protein (TIGR02147 family)
MELENSKAIGFPEIENYTCFRMYLADFYKYKKSVKTQFSYRQFAKSANIKSPNFLQLVMQNKRNLSPEKAVFVAKAMKLSSVEIRYFLALVNRENARDDELKHKAARELLISAKKLCEKKMPLAQKDILKRWYSLVVRELITLPDFKWEGSYISKKLRGYISEAEADQILIDLKNAGFIRFQGGKWIQADPVLTTGEAYDEERILNHHQENLKVWSKSLKDFSSEERELGLLNIPIHSEKIPELQQRIRDFQNEIVGWLKDESDPQRVVQLGVYLIPISK